MRVIVLTSDRYLWAVKPFSYLFNIYWSSKKPFGEHVLVAGFSPPDFKLPDNFTFYSIDKEDYPQERWSNALIKLLTEKVNDDYFILMLEDYWLCRTVDTDAVEKFYRFAKSAGDILRFDLTTDRMYARGDPRDAHEIKPIDHYDIVYTPPGTPYQMSFQAAIWSRKMMLDILEPEKTPWQVEINTEVRDDFGVVGSKQHPVRYANAIRKGKIDEDQIKLIPAEHYNHIKGYIPNDFSVEVE